MSIKTDRGKYVSTKIEKGKYLVDAKSTAIGENEIWEVVIRSDGYVVLKSALGKYMIAHGPSTWIVEGGSQHPNGYGEALMPEFLGKGKVAFKTKAGRYLAVQSDGALKNLKVDAVGTTETFEIVPASK